MRFSELISGQKFVFKPNQTVYYRSKHGNGNGAYSSMESNNSVYEVIKDVGANGKKPTLKECIVIGGQFPISFKFAGCVSTSKDATDYEVEIIN